MAYFLKDKLSPVEAQPKASWPYVGCGTGGHLIN